MSHPLSDDPYAPLSVDLDVLDRDEALRRRLFPVCAERIFLAHAGVCPLPACGIEAMQRYATLSGQDMQEARWVWPEVMRARRTAAELLGCSSSEISLLGPTSLGLNIVAQGLDWQPGDRVLCYADDYPANVYPWMDLERHGVVVDRIEPDRPGYITAEHVAACVGPRTRLVALASCNYMSGYRIDIAAIGSMLRARGILFCVDGIQTLGAFRTHVEHVDFLAADAHKWMLGPCGAGLLYVARGVREQCRPVLLGAWNVVSPHYVAQDEIAFEPGGRRYEPGTLNLGGILPMTASLEMLNAIGVERISARLLALRARLLEGLLARGFRIYGAAGETGDPVPAAARSSIVGAVSDRFKLRAVYEDLDEQGISLSRRQTRAGELVLRFSPHFYNTPAEIDRVLDALPS